MSTELMCAAGRTMSQNAQIGSYCTFYLSQVLLAAQNNKILLDVCLKESYNMQTHTHTHKI